MNQPKYCFYQYLNTNYIELLGSDKLIFKNGKSNIKEGIISRQSSYESESVDHAKFINILIVPKEYYDNDKIEILFSMFIKKYKYGKRLNHIRRKCELYNYYQDPDFIMNEFYKCLKNKNVDCELLTKEQVEELNNNYKKSLKENDNNQNSKLDSDDFFEPEREEDIDFNFYDYQQKTIDQYNGETGILSYTMGLGKTITCQGLINKLRELGLIVYGNKIYWITMRKDILKTQIGDFEIFKKLFNFNIIDMVSVDKKDINKKFNECKDDKLNIILINIGSLKKIKHIIPSVCIYDECHGITGEYIYEYLKDMKTKQIPIIGLSATPMKLNNSKSNRIKEIFGDNNKINFIDLITYADAIDNKLVVPLTMKWLNNVNVSGKISNKEQSKRIFNNNLETLKKISSLHRKVILWTNTTTEANDLHKRLIKNFNGINIYLSHSKNDIESIEIQKFIKDNSKCFLVCINRFKEGSNDKELSCGVYYSYVNRQAEHVFLQQIGRLTRISNRKTGAEFYQLLDNKNPNEKIDYIVNSILKYIEEMTDSFENITISLNSSGISFETKRKNRFFNLDVSNVTSINKIELERIYNSLKHKTKHLTYDKFIDILEDNKIINDEQYQIFRNNNSNLNLPENIFSIFGEFNWSIVYNMNEYYNINECMGRLYKFNKYNKIDMKRLRFNKRVSFFNKNDNKMPPMLPWLFYGMKYKDSLTKYY